MALLLRVQSLQWSSWLFYLPLKDRNNLWVIGGFSEGQINLNDVWHSTDGSSWERLDSGALSTPPCAQCVRFQGSHMGHGRFGWLSLQRRLESSTAWRLAALRKICRSSYKTRTVLNRQQRTASSEAARFFCEQRLHKYRHKIMNTQGKHLVLLIYSG